MNGMQEVMHYHKPVQSVKHTNGKVITITIQKGEIKMDIFQTAMYMLGVDYEEVKEYANNEE